jgi:DNA modification methylase
MSSARDVPLSSVRHRGEDAQRGRLRTRHPNLSRRRRAKSPLKDSSPSPLPWRIEMVPLRHLRCAARILRAHPKNQLKLLTRNMQQFGCTNPPLLTRILRSSPAMLGLKRPRRQDTTRSLSSSSKGRSDTEKRTLALADNRIAELGGWLKADLAVELHELGPLLEGAGLSTDLTGFQPAIYDALVCDVVDSEHDPADAIAAEAHGDAVTRRGDLYELGPHKILCGDATESTDLRALMGKNRAELIFADPPYNVKIKSVQGRGKTKHREFAQGSGELRPDQFVRFLSTSLSLAARYSVNGSIHFVCMDWRHIRELQTAGDEVYSELKNIVVWVKTNGGMGSFYRSQHEFVFVFKNGDAPHLNNIELGQHGRNRTNVWTYAGVNAFRSGRLDDLATHPTTKPVAIVADAMRDCSRRGDIVLDPFLGSGTTILAAEKVGRRGYGLELDPLYVDAAIRRWQAYTKRDAILKATGQTFDEVAAERAGKKARGRA